MKSYDSYDRYEIDSDSNGFYGFVYLFEMNRFSIDRFENILLLNLHISQNILGLTK